MGRKKIELKRIECVKERSSKFSKRKKGIFKKAQEIAELCDTDIALLSFSPTSNKPLLFHSRPLSRILEKFSKVSLQDREDRRAYTIKTLKKMYKDTTDTETPTENQHLTCERYIDLAPESDEVLEEDSRITELRNARKLLDEKTSILKDWHNPFRVDDLERLKIMEKYLIASLGQIRKMKIQEDQ